eukprot:8666900-Pyramimonas_sp.AAC.1
MRKLRSNGHNRRAPRRRRSPVHSFPGRNLQDSLPRVPLPKKNMLMPAVLISQLPKHLVGPRTRQVHQELRP